MAYRLVINPDSDEDFTTHVQRAASAEMSDPGELETELRDEYPAVVVRTGVTEADGRKRWYVYRDGRWVQAQH